MSKTNKPTVEDDEEEEEEEEDVDDLDDVLESFNKPKSSQQTQNTSSSAPPPLPPPNNNNNNNDLDFEADLAKGMESLLASFGLPPPASGPSSISTGVSSSSSNTQANTKSKSASTIGTGKGNQNQKQNQPSIEQLQDQERQMQALLARMLKGEQVDDEELDGLLGLVGDDADENSEDNEDGEGGDGEDGEDGHGENEGGKGENDFGGNGAGPGTSTATATTKGKAKAKDATQQDSTNPSSSASKPENLSFEQTIKQTMENLKKTSAQRNSNPNPSSASDPLAALLSQLSSMPPGALDGLAGGLGGAGPGAGLGGEGEDVDGIGKLLDGMMGQLMSREVLEEPLMELAEKYPPYLKEKGSSLPQETLTNYTSQLTLINQILTLFQNPSYTDEPSEKDLTGQAMKKQVGELMGKMQELGSPPEEVMGDVEGMEGLGLGGEGMEGCCIM